MLHKVQHSALVWDMVNLTSFNLNRLWISWMCIPLI